MSDTPAVTDLVDYRATSLRPTWAALPGAVRAEAERLVGSTVVGAAPPVTSGFTGSYAGRVTLADGREVFVKAGGPATPHVVSALEQEARVLAELPRGIPAPELVAAGLADGWRLLVLAALAARMPGQPWTGDDLDAAHEACVTIAGLTTPAPPALHGPGVAEQMAADEQVMGFARALGAGRAPLPDWTPGWVGGRAGDLSDLALGCLALLEGDTLVHGDLRPDNLLVDPAGRAWVVDWNWVGLGPRWVDLVGLLPLARAQGLDTDALEASSPLLSDADPDAVDGYLATIACYILEGVHRPPPPGCTPALRAHQRLMAIVFLEHVAHRRGWGS